MVQIIQICKFFLFLTLVSNFTFGYSKNLESNTYGDFLSWEYAKGVNDIESLQRFFKKLDLNRLDTSLLEEVFFESVILEDWVEAEKISEIILGRDKDNFSANLFKFFDGFYKNHNVDIYLEEVDSKYIDLNFLKIIKIWKNFENNKTISSDFNNCLPIICLHSGIFYFMKGEHNLSQKFFERLGKKEFESYRIKELLLLWSLNSNTIDSDKYLTQLNKYDLNIQNHDLKYLMANKTLLNPILTKTHGMAEVLYNISSWFYSKSLYKYSAFFGKLSIRFRPNFNAMKLLLSGALQQLEYHNLGMKYVNNSRDDNLYYYKFMKTKLSFFEEKDYDEKFLLTLTEFTKNYPERVEMKIILGDKLRKMKKYNDAIKVYTEIINNKQFSSNWDVYYSRGISYERINKWNKAELDLKKALKLNPEDPYVLNYLAYSWLDRKVNIEEALKLLKKAVKIEPSDAYIIDSLGWAYFLNNRTEESIFFLEKAVSILPDDATLNDHLGDAYWKANRKEEALSQWKRVLILDPNFKEKFLINKKIKNGF